jgi:hypothetical protein
MMWMCPACWSTFGVNHLRCPACGADLESLDQRSYLDKLVRALDHPDGDTAIRAAEVLARRFDADEIIPLLAAAVRRRGREPYVAAGFVRALRHFPKADTQHIIGEALAHESAIVRTAANQAIRRPPVLADSTSR